VNFFGTNTLSNWADNAFRQPVFGQLKIVNILVLIFLVLLVILIEKVLRKFLLMRLLKRTAIDPDLQFAVGRMLGYCILILGFYIAFQAAGLNLSSLAVLAGALGVGVGFSLQNILSNFVSGIIILAERPISIGDRIEVGGVAGQVKHISLRSTTVITNDNISIIVPNADFITHAVTNWSHGDDKVRIRLPVTVAFGSDVARVKALLLEVADENSQALKVPAPAVFFDSFVDYGFKFELAVWTEEMTFSPRRFRSDLNYAIEAKFRANQIQIAFPRRGVQMLDSSHPQSLSGDATGVASETAS